MSAFEELIEHNGSASLPALQRALVSSRGSLISGQIPEYVDLTSRANQSRYSFLDEEEELEDVSSVSQLGRMFIRKQATRTPDYGFIFNQDGTEKIIRSALNGSPLMIYNDLRDDFLFADSEKESLWQNASDLTKKRLIMNNIVQMLKKTDVQYRTHGDRLHYLVIGKVIADVQDNYRSERNVYPLFLFSCQGTDIGRMSVEVEQSGFLNFSLDENILNSEISRLLKSTSIELDRDLPSTLTRIQQHLSKVVIPGVDSLAIDPTFSMIGIITGFETEYLDPAWEKIIK